ncbi:MAG: regulatory protein RecX [Dehalococcoidia bacterium]
MRTRLLRQRHAPDIVDETIDWLREYEFVDDEAFAEFWTENRVLFRPRGQRLLRYELARRGVTQETARLAVEGVDEEDGAYRAAIKRATRLPHADEALFRRRLSEFLTRRGFDHEVISRVVERVWREAQVA